MSAAFNMLDGPAPERTAQAVFEAILAGASFEEVDSTVRRLAPEEFGILLCTLCMVRDEVAGVNAERAHTMETLLGEHCRDYVHGKRNCATDQRARLFPSA